MQQKLWIFMIFHMIHCLYLRLQNCELLLTAVWTDIYRFYSLRQENRQKIALKWARISLFTKISTHYFFLLPVIRLMVFLWRISGKRRLQTAILLLSLKMEKTCICWRICLTILIRDRTEQTAVQDVPCMTGSTVIISLISLWQKSTHRIYGIPDGMVPQKVQMLREQVFRNMGGKKSELFRIWIRKKCFGRLWWSHWSEINFIKKFRNMNWIM